MSPVHVGYAAMSGGVPPRELVELCRLAEHAGFSGVMAADQLQPWLPVHDEAPHVWTLLAAIAEHTTGDLGPGAVAPIHTVHPFVIAQASATLAALHPGRHWLGIGAGEALSAHIAGRYWPEAPERLEMMWEAVDVIRKLFSGKEVRHRGEYVALEKSRLWTIDEKPPVLIATDGPVTARRAGREADGIITTASSVEKVAALMSRFDEGARDAGRSPSSLLKVLRVQLSWAPTQEEAERAAVEQWPMAAFGAVKSDLRSPYDVEQLTRRVRADDLHGRLLITSDPDVIRAQLQRYLDLGIDRLYLHNVGQHERDWIATAGREIVPRLTA